MDDCSDVPCSINIYSRRRFRYPTLVAVSVFVARGPLPPNHSSAKTYACMTTAYDANAARAERA